MMIVKCERCGRYMPDIPKTNMCNKCIIFILNQYYGKKVVLPTELKDSLAKESEEYMKNTFGPSVYVDTDSVVYKEETCKTCDGTKKVFETYDDAGNIIYKNCEACSNNVEKEWYYNAGDVECIDGIKSAIGQLKGTEAFYTGNIIKYIWRWKHKNGVEDLKKAKTYLEWLIEEVDK